jgi:hypothetical protein
VDLIPGAPLPLTLFVLALVDGLSVGTLVIPLLLMIVPGKVHVRRHLLYLTTISLFYLAVGVLFLLGLMNVVDVVGDFFSSTAGAVLRLVIGAGLLIAAFAMPAHEKRMRERPDAEPGRIARWRDRLVSDGVPARTVIAVAIGAGVVELATMLPYLIGMTLLAESSLSLPMQVAILGAYCLVMILPAIVLLGLRILASRLIERPLERLAAWFVRTAGETTSWIIGIIGFLLARAAATELGLFDLL